MAKYISNTALLWIVLCCGVPASVGLAGSNVSRGSQRIQPPVHGPGHGPRQPHEDVARSARQLSEPKLVNKRCATTNCCEVESPAEPGLHKMKEIHELEYTFYIKPKSEFRALVFNMKINNLWNAKGPYTTDEKVVFSGSEMGVEDVDSWREVQVTYYRHKVWMGRDNHGLTVSVGNLSQSIRSSGWWMTHSFEGFVLLVEGPAKLLFSCLPRNAGQQMPVQLLQLQEPVVLGCVLGGAIVLVVAVWVILAVTRPAPPSDNPPPVPPLPESLLLQRGQKDDPEATYEEFNEAKLVRLRQMLDPNTFASCSGVSSGDTPTGRHEAAGGDGTKISRPICGEGVGKFSLLEEKQKAWLENPSGPAPESHYLEMHGIINGNSDLAH